MGRGEESFLEWTGGRVGPGLHAHTGGGADDDDDSAVPFSLEQKRRGGEFPSSFPLVFSR